MDKPVYTCLQKTEGAVDKPCLNSFCLLTWILDVEVRGLGP